MVFAPEDVTDGSPSLPMMSTPVKNRVLGNHCVFSPTYFMLNMKQ